MTKPESALQECGVIHPYSKRGPCVREQGHLGHHLPAEGLGFDLPRQEETLQCPNHVAFDEQPCPNCPPYTQPSLVERVIHRADERAIADYNARLRALGDTAEADLLREGFHYGCRHGRADGFMNA